MIKLSQVFALLLASYSYHTVAQTSLVVDINSYDISYYQTIEITNNTDSTQNLSYYYGKYTSSGASVATLPTTITLDTGDTKTTVYSAAADENSSFTTTISLSNEDSGDSCKITLSYDTDDNSVTDRSYSTSSCDSSFELANTSGETLIVDIN